MKKADSSISAIYGFKSGDKIVRPLFSSGVSAGFPSPADDYIERHLDLNEFLITTPAATFFIRVSGESMTGSGIYHNDILIVDRSITPSSGKIVIAIVNGELTVKKLHKTHNTCLLIADNPSYEDIKINKETDLEIWGVVTSSIHIL